MISGENFRNDQARTEYQNRIHPQPSFYVWQAPGTVLSIHLSLDVVAELTAEHDRWNSGGLSDDIHGVLLGRSMSGAQHTTYVEDIVLIPRSGIGTGDARGTASENEL